MDMQDLTNEDILREFEAMIALRATHAAGGAQGSPPSDYDIADLRDEIMLRMKDPQVFDLSGEFDD